MREFLCDSFSRMILDSCSSFSLFLSGRPSRVGMPSYPNPLSQIFFNLTTLFSYPVFFCLFYARLDLVVHFLIFLRSFRFKSFLSQFSSIVTLIKNFCSDLGFSLLMMFAKDLTGYFSHSCVEGGDH